MNTTPSISNQPGIPYTVVGGFKIDRIRKYSYRLTVLLLNRGGRFYRKELLSEIQKLKLGEIICIEGPNIPYDIEPLSRQFPEIRFLLLQGNASEGERINLGIEEARSELVLVMWSDMQISSTSLMVRDSGVLCSVPLLMNHKSETIPSIQIPALIKGKLRLIPREPTEEGMDTILPFDFCGIYSKAKYRLIGGFNRLISNSYWQKLDFGFRAFLWGERIVFNPGLKLNYSVELQSENTTADESYKLFYLRNLAVHFRGDSGILPYSRLLNYMMRSDTGPIYAYKEFREVRKWVEINRYRFRKDAQSLVSHWKMPE